MKVKSKKFKLFSWIAMFIVALFALTFVFAACSDDEEQNNEQTNKGYTIEDSGITLGGEMLGNGETINVSSASEIVSALNSAEAGDTIVIAEGTYNFSAKIQLRQNGEYNNYITVRAADGADVVFDFSEMAFASTNRGVELYGDYWYWYGLEFVGAGDNGFYIGGNYNVVEYCEFHDNRDTGLQLGRDDTGASNIAYWPSYNYIKNCTSYNNYDNETAGENADGFAAKLTVGYGNVFDGCIAYRNSDDGWDLYAYNSNGDIGAVIIYNCVAFENGFLGETVDEFNADKTTNEEALENYNTKLEAEAADEAAREEAIAEGRDPSIVESSYVPMYTYTTSAGDGNGFKLGGSIMRGNVKLYNCMAFQNKMHGVTDNSNPGVLTMEGITSYNNGATVDTDPSSPTFGQVNGSASGDDQCNNMDTARHDYSYNNFKDILSVANALTSTYGTPGNDAYRGSVSNSIFFAGNNSYRQFTDYEDAYSDVSGMNGTALEGGITASEVFDMLPITVSADNSFVYNISGINKDAQGVNSVNYDIHETYRNADESVNMGDILAITDPAAVNNTGATLNLDSWEDYTHYFDTELCEASSVEDSVLMAVYNTLYLYCDTDAVYQDMTLTTSILGCNISWSTSDDSILHINKAYNSSNSSSQDIDLIVYRPAQDTTVTLTANINYRGHTAVKSWDITVKAADPYLGDVYVDELADAVLDSERRIIIDQYQAYEEPRLVVEDGSDYNGKTLADGTYTVEAKYEYASGLTSAYSVVGAFSPSEAGVYRITYTVTYDGATSSYTYYIYVASNNADVDFVSGTVTVYRDGYILSGDLTNVKGTLYSYSTSDSAEIASLEGMTDVEKVAAIGGDAVPYEFTATDISAHFANENDQAYTVYYWFANGAGEVTSQVYVQQVSVVEIATPQDFITQLSANNAYTIYKLTADLDFTGVSYYTIGNLRGLINGDGHTISNLNISGGSRTGLFSYMDGGTIMNVHFDETTITATDTRSGLIGNSRGGYLHNILITNIQVNGSGRTAALVGTHTEGDLYVSQISVENDDQHTISSTTGNDLGAIIGLVQSGGAGETLGSVTISDVFVDSTINGAGRNYVGGVVGRFEDRSVQDKLTIERCYVIADLIGQTYVGGILAAQNNSAGGEYVITLSECVFMGSITYAGEPLLASVKNSSGIFGRYTETAILTIDNCVSNLYEYGYPDYVSTVNVRLTANESFWTGRYVETYDFTGDPENDVYAVWEFMEKEIEYDDDYNQIDKSPYIRLRMDGMFGRDVDYVEPAD